ncbi:hypothetical protein JCM10207_005147 [Rhodosporidiobolus poonsookiae]
MYSTAFLPPTPPHHFTPFASTASWSPSPASHSAFPRSSPFVDQPVYSPSSFYPSPPPSPPRSAYIDIKPEVRERLKRRLSGGTTSPLYPAQQYSAPLSFPCPSQLELPTAEDAERVFLNTISFPARVTRFVNAWRARFLPASMSLLYPSSEPYALSSASFDITSLPADPLQLVRGGKQPCTWVRAPALAPRVDHLSFEQRKRMKGVPAPALPAMAPTRGGPSAPLIVGGDRWQFIKHGEELDVAHWDVLLEGGQRLKVTFDQAFRA